MGSLSLFTDSEHCPRARVDGQGTCGMKSGQGPDTQTITSQVGRHIRAQSSWTTPTDKARSLEPKPAHLYADCLARETIGDEAQRVQAPCPKLHSKQCSHSNPDPLLPKTVSSHTIYEVSRLCSLLQPDCFPQPAPKDRQTDG